MIKDFPFQASAFVHSLRNQWKSSLKINRLQEKRFLKLIKHAYENVPFYTKKFEAARIKPSDIRTSDDIRILPVSSKKEMQDVPTHELISQGLDLRTCTRYLTSGTTGTPLNIFFRPRDETMINMTWIRAFLTGGMKVHHRLAAFIGKEKSVREQAWYEHLGIFRRLEISNWMTPEHWIKDLQPYRPDAIIGDTISLRLLAETVSEQSNTQISPKIIFNTSILLDPFSRNYLRDIFRCKVIDLYGSFEGGCLAWECPQCSGYHVSADMSILEILKDGLPVGPGEDGEVFLTNLYSYAMPFIRYRLGDRVSLSKNIPTCGRNSPLLGEILGRKDDYILLGNKKKIACQPFYHILNPIPGIKKWRIIQETLNDLSIVIVPAPEFNKNSILEIQREISRLVGGQLEIKIDLVKSIDHDPKYKYRSVITKAGGIFGS